MGAVRSVLDSAVDVICKIEEREKTTKTKTKYPYNEYVDPTNWHKHFETKLKLNPFLSKIRFL